LGTVSGSDFLKRDVLIDEDGEEEKGVGNKEERGRWKQRGNGRWIQGQKRCRLNV